MNFETTYTKEQEEFRMEVRAWIEANVPENMRTPRGTPFGTMGEQAGDRAPEIMAFWKEKHQELGKKGWLYPDYPKKYGGGGLTGDHETIIQEEFHRGRVVPVHSDTHTIDPILVWGTEEQKQKFVVPLLRGEKTSHRKLTEPQSGADSANVRTRAVKDGDDWLITGQNVFISTFAGVDYLSGQAMTDPEAPRHRNTGYFLVPNPSPGLEIVPMKGMGGGQKFVFMDNVRVPADHLIAGPTQGWQVMGTVMHSEHGGSGYVASEDSLVTNLVDFMQESRKKWNQPGGNPVLQGETVDVWIDHHIKTLFDTRTRWLSMNRNEMSWQGPFGRMFTSFQIIRTKARVNHVMGIYAQLNKNDPLAPYDGMVDYAQQHRSSHGGGALNVTRIIVARGIGISRTKERPVPTRMTAPNGVGAAGRA